MSLCVDKQTKNAHKETREERHKDTNRDQNMQQSPRSSVYSNHLLVITLYYIVVVVSKPSLYLLAHHSR